MSKFFVGQRVRVVNAPFHPQFVGAETRISRVAFGEYEAQGYEWIVQLMGEPYGACSHHLEPILPSGAQPSEYTTLHDLLTSLEGVHA